MPYLNAKIYSDGGHYVAIPQGAYPSRKGRQRRGKQNVQIEIPPPRDLIELAERNAPRESTKSRFEKAYAESRSLPKRERKSHIRATLKNDFATKDELSAYVERNTERKRSNEIRRKIRLYRKLNLQRWNYFCTFTYDDNLHTEETFRKKLSNTLKHFVSRNGWKYVGVWERSPEKQRLHFHGIFYIPKLVGEIIETKDYSTKTHKTQITYQNTHFLKRFGRNDFKPIQSKYEIPSVAKYIAKYMEKTGEKLVYGGKLPTFFLSDIVDEDVICPFGAYDAKLLLYDKFTCIKDGEIIGEVGEETIKQMKKCN